MDKKRKSKKRKKNVNGVNWKMWENGTRDVVEHFVVWLAPF